jgi:hypothetical protein
VVTSLILAQSNYPLKTVIKGDSVVILTIKQADDINNIFESQKAKIASFKKDILLRDSIIAIRDTLLLEKERVIVKHEFDYEIARRLEVLENWMLNASIDNVWMYYSWEDSLIYAVDLSQYLVKKDDMTGDIFFYRCDDLLDPRKEREQPHKGWNYDIIKPKRPKIMVAPIKL